MRMRRKAWTEPELASCPYFIEQPSAHRGHWRECFKHDQPVYLEIGCGKGQCGSCTVIMDGGSLDLSWDPASKEIVMTGPATTVYEGVIQI